MEGGQPMFMPIQLFARRVFALGVFALFTSLAFAAGDDDTTPPAPTPTPRCPEGQIHDRKVEKCVPVKSGALNDDDRYQAVRELAYLERYTAALMVLDAMSDQRDDRVLTYRGFIKRKVGQMDQAFQYYRDAIDKNPDNLLARSYMGQGFVELGDIPLARRQHQEILTRGGQGTWAEVSLRDALASGRTYRY